MNRELDCMVAEKVMGWGWHEVCNPHLNDGKPKRIFTWAPTPWDAEQNYITGLNKTVPPYSSDISAAWEVVEKMIALQPSIEWSEEEQIWYVRFDKSHPTAMGCSNTAPHAICLAALKVKGVE